MEKPVVAGIVAEYNPFHNGHAHQINVTRNAGATHIVAVMSGNFVQRGGPACMSKIARANAAVACGVDLVLELPLPFAAATAERFAFGAVSVLGGLGCVDVLSFGSECGDLELLSKATEAVLSPYLSDYIKNLLDGGNITYARARQKAVEALYGEQVAQVLESPNNTLAVEYLKQIALQKLRIAPFTVRRAGAAHDSPTDNGAGAANLSRSSAGTATSNATGSSTGAATATSADDENSVSTDGAASSAATGSSTGAATAARAGEENSGTDGAASSAATGTATGAATAANSDEQNGGADGAATYNATGTATGAASSASASEENSGADGAATSTATGSSTGAATAAPAARLVSASYIRNLLDLDSVDALEPFVPPAAFSVFHSAGAAGLLPFLPHSLDAAVLARLRSMSREDFSRLPDVSDEGLDNRLYDAARSAVSLDELLSLAKTKRYTLSRIRRLVWNAFLGVPAELTRLSPPYARVLSFNKRGLEILTMANKTTSLPVSHSLAKLESRGGDCEQFAKLEARATDLFSLGLPLVQPCGGDYTQKISVR